jgi:hypothetical protein
VQVYGIHGFGGTGKTTLAKALYNHLYLRFEGRHTCIELEEGLDQKDLVAKQQNILHHLCGIQSDIGSIAQGQQLLCDSMRHTGVLLLLDNVCNADQRDALFPESLRLPPGSLVIMTARTEGLLKHGHYGVEKRRTDLLEAAEAMQLLCMCAFNHSEPPRQVRERVASVVEACHGVPVVLEVVGCFLKDMEYHDYEVRAS